MLHGDILRRLNTLVGERDVVSNPAEVSSGSRDCFWFSPVLKPLLEGKAADVIVRPRSERALLDVVALCASEGIPITPRGAGTGNYGQGVPLAGGVLVNLKGLNSIVDVTPAAMTAQAGVVLQQMETRARDVGAELRMFPSTIPNATAGGFVCGGSGGIGSIRWGMLFDEGNVLGARAVTIEPEPRVLVLETPTELRDVIHNCGVTAILTEVTLALAPAERWFQYVVAFNSLEQALVAGERLAYDEEIPKRLVTVFEWPIPSYFVPLRKRGACPDGMAVLFVYTTLDENAFAAHPAVRGGEITYHAPPQPGAGRGTQIYDYTWNHTTLWAMKADPSLTYLQDAFDAKRLHEQWRERKARFGDEVYLHTEFMKSRGALRPGGLSIVRFTSKERLWELIEFCESIGITVSNPHTFYLDDDRRWYGDNLLRAKARWDPRGLLNPGHLHALEAG